MNSARSSIWPARILSVGGVLTLAAMFGVVVSGSASAAEAKVGLGTAANFAVLAGSTVTNTGPSELVGFDLGLSPGTAVTGFPPGKVDAPGAQHITDGVAAQAQSDLTIAFNDAAGRSASKSGLTDLVGQTLQPGVYQGNALSLSGTVTLDNNNVPDAVFIFQAASTLITSSSSVVKFTNADHPSCNVFWEVGASATLGTNSTFAGSLLAQASISAQTGASVQGRLLARVGAVTLDDNKITRLSCAPTGTPTSAASPTPPTSAQAPPPISTTAGTSPVVPIPPVTNPVIPPVTNPVIPPVVGPSAPPVVSTSIPRDVTSGRTVPILLPTIPTAVSITPFTPSTSSIAPFTPSTVLTTPSTAGRSGSTSALVSGSSSSSITAGTELTSGQTSTESTGLTSSTLGLVHGNSGGGSQATGLATTGATRVPQMMLGGFLAVLVGGLMMLLVKGRRLRTGGQHRA